MADVAVPVRSRDGTAPAGRYSAGPQLSVAARDRSDLLVIRTLIVEDDPIVATVHRGFVERVPGFSVVGVVARGRDAIAAVDHLRPQLVLLDLYLPDMPGLEVARHLRRPGRAATDVIVVTRVNDVATVRSAMQHGALHYLVKPVTFTALEQKLGRYAALSERLAQQEHANQEDVDQLFQVLHTGLADTLPKGLSPATLDLVARVLSESDSDLSAGEIADVVGVSRVTARRYLEHLAAHGVAVVSLRYGAAGRPQHRFRSV
jgi:response regulator of citrate/malate metabolism